jgi:hypothetical protein
VDSKELFESCEFWHRTRRRVRRRVVVDLACGCGLTGVLFAVAERSVERVILVDRMETDSLQQVLAAAEAAAPWALAKITFVRSDIAPGTLRRVLRDIAAEEEEEESSIIIAEEETVDVKTTTTSETSDAETTTTEETAAAETVDGETVYEEEEEESPECVGVLAVHACGSLTDVILAEAITCGAVLAAMPWCGPGGCVGKSEIWCFLFGFLENRGFCLLRSTAVVAFENVMTLRA